MTMHPAERLLPAPEQVELAEYLMGSYLSELETIASRVKHETGWEADLTDKYTIEAAAELSGVELCSRDLDRVELLELLRFATDAVQDAESIREQAVELQTALLSELRDKGAAPPDEQAAYRRRIRGYHEARPADEHAA